MDQKPGIVFDLDGTLIDSAPEIRGIANAILADEGAAPLSAAETRSFIGRGVPVFVARMMAARDLPAERAEVLTAAFMAEYQQAVGETRLYPGVIAALEDLQAAGFVMGLCTNKPEGPTRHVIAHFGLGRFFGSVIGGDTMPVKKPDPAPLHACFEALGAHPVLYVGDSETDHETAARAAIPFALFTEGYRKSPLEDVPPARRFDDFAALPGIARAALAPA